mgnify:CR=1 FL=1|jgi:hypothetical protein
MPLTPLHANLFLGASNGLDASALGELRDNVITLAHSDNFALLKCTNSSGAWCTQKARSALLHAVTVTLQPVNVSVVISDSLSAPMDNASARAAFCCVLKWRDSQAPRAIRWWLTMEAGLDMIEAHERARGRAYRSVLMVRVNVKLSAPIPPTVADQATWFSAVEPPDVSRRPRLERSLPFRGCAFEGCGSGPGV